MGQKVNPVGMRIGLIRDWSSRWFANDKDFSTFLAEDHAIRSYLQKTLERSCLLSRIDIERKKTDKGYNVTVNIFCARPGIVLGEKGANVEVLKKQISKLTNKSNVKINVVEIKEPNLDARIVATTIAMQLESRASFRIAQKKAIMTSRRSGARGIKTKVGGRLGGAEIARAEGYKEGTMAINTLKTDVDFAIEEAHTTYGKLGVKVWIAREDKGFNNFNEDTQKLLAPQPKENREPRPERRPRPERKDSAKGE